MAANFATGIPWSEDFMRQYAAALDGVKEQAKQVGANRTIPGSFNALCVSYYRSPDFRDLKPSTQVMRRNIIEKFRIAHGGKPLKASRHRAHQMTSSALKPTRLKQRTTCSRCRG